MVVSHSVCARVGGLKILRDPGAPPLGTGAWLHDPLETWSSLTCHHTKFRHSRLKHMSVITEIRQKKIRPIARHLSRSLKVIATDTVRSAPHEFLLTFHNNDEPTSYRFRDKRRFLKKKNSPSRI